MKRRLALVALVGAACGGNQLTITAEDARAALPSATQAQIGTPAATPGSSSNLLLDSPSATATAEYAADTIALATAVNGGVAWTLGIVSFVASLPPTSCAGDTCTWGPGSSALEVNDWQLTVTRKGLNDYAWSLQGRPKSTPGASWIPFLSGEAFTTGIRHVGHGTLLVDLDAAAGLARKTSDPAPQPGTISGTYDNTAGAHVALQFLGTQDSTNPQQKVNVAYDFVSTVTGGELQLATRNLSTSASLKLRSRWISTGAGRGDASYTAGTLTVTRTQCWDSAATLFNLLFQSTGSVVDVGSEAACAFTPAAAPAIAVP